MKVNKFGVPYHSYILTFKNGDEKIFAITPSGKMKELIKGDTDLEK